MRFVQGREYFENLYADRDQYSTQSSPEERKRIEKSLLLFDRYVPRKRLVLDLGCGEGSVTRALRDRGHNVVSLDLAQAALQNLEGSRVPLVKLGWRTATSFEDPIGMMFDADLDRAKTSLLLVEPTDSTAERRTNRCRKRGRNGCQFRSARQA